MLKLIYIYQRPQLYITENLHPGIIKTTLKSLLSRRKKKDAENILNQFFCLVANLFLLLL